MESISELVVVGFKVTWGLLVLPLTVCSTMISAISKSLLLGPQPSLFSAQLLFRSLQNLRLDILSAPALLSCMRTETLKNQYTSVNPCAPHCSPHPVSFTSQPGSHTRHQWVAAAWKSHLHMSTLVHVSTFCVNLQCFKVIAIECWFVIYWNFRHNFLEVTCSWGSLINLF